MNMGENDLRDNLAILSRYGWRWTNTGGGVMCWLFTTPTRRYLIGDAADDYGVSVSDSSGEPLYEFGFEIPGDVITWAKDVSRSAQRADAAAELLEALGLLEALDRLEREVRAIARKGSSVSDAAPLARAAIRKATGERS